MYVCSHSYRYMHTSLCSGHIWATFPGDWTHTHTDSSWESLLVTGPVTACMHVCTVCMYMWKYFYILMTFAYNNYYSK